MTTWLCGIESRWWMAAPSRFVATFRRKLENELPVDTEQCPPRALSLGLDHGHLLATLAGKHLLILAQQFDYFDVRRTAQTYEGLIRLWEILGRADQIELFVGLRGHGYSKENRAAVCRMFNRATGLDSGDSEPPIKIEQDKDLWASQTGQVAELHGKTVYSYTKELSMRLSQRRGRCRATT